MRFTYLGTGASEGYPTAWCVCENCERARSEGGRSFRNRQAALLDGKLLFDFGPDLFVSVRSQGIRLNELRSLFITHSHSDHFLRLNLLTREENFHPVGLKPLTVYGSKEAIGRLADSTDLNPQSGQMTLQSVEPFAPFTVGEYTVVALPATHSKPPLEPYLYAITDGRSSLLYAHDTGNFSDDVWDYLSHSESSNAPDWRFDIVSIDMTHGTVSEKHDSHLNLDDVKAHRERLTSLGLLAPGARFIASHLSHTDAPIHSELVKTLAGSGIEAAYDGLTIEV